MSVRVEVIRPNATLDRVGIGIEENTVANVQKAGFRLRREENVYLDIIKIIEAVKPSSATKADSDLP
jgi:hypothetical protein